MTELDFGRGVRDDRRECSGKHGNQDCEEECISQKLGCATSASPVKAASRANMVIARRSLGDMEVGKMW